MADPIELAREVLEDYRLGKPATQTSTRTLAQAVIDRSADLDTCHNAIAIAVDARERAEQARDDALRLLRADPTAEDKAVLIGEFLFAESFQDADGNEITRFIEVPWTTIKQIRKAVLSRIDALLEKG